MQGSMGRVGPTTEERIADLGVRVVEEFTGPGLQTRPVRDVPLRAKRKRWGLEVLFTDGPVTGKVLYRKADPDYGGVVQYHTHREETFLLFEGRALLRWDPTGDGWLREEEIGPGSAFHVPAGARHSVIALTDCVFFEVSTGSGAVSDRVDVNHQYAPPPDPFRS